MEETGPLLSAVVVVGDCRKRAQRVLDAIGSQRCIDVMEVIVVDLASEPAAPLQPREGTRTIQFRRPRNTPWGQARAEALRRATSPIVAFLEDHCYPTRGWAEALLEAHRGPWAAVGYAFVNANPVSYLARCAMLTDYGRFAHPLGSGPATLLPYNNVSYKREALLSLGSELDLLLSSDFHVHQAFQRRGLPMYLEGRAIAAHENFTRLGALMRANHNYSRHLAATRLSAENWSLARRLFYVAATPFGAPLIALGRLLKSLRGRSVLRRQVLAALPVIAVAALCTALGEALGYAFGAGSSEQELTDWELHIERGAPG